LSTSTSNLSLYKADPTTDGIETFNIKTMMNDNWDKIDEAVGNKAELPVSSSKDTLITSTNSQVIASYTPTASGNYEIKAYLRLLSAANVTLLLTYSDATGAQTKALLPMDLGLFFPTTTGIQSYKTGSYQLKPLFINVKAGSTITLLATASVANKVYVSSGITEV
jgi:hypothetical protein